MAKTKIVATIGPTCESKEKIREMIIAGVDVFRFNMKHGQLSWHEKEMKLIRQVAAEIKQPVAILLDLQGPEIRSGRLKKGKMSLKKNEIIFLTSNQELANKASYKIVVIDKLEVIASLKPGQRVLMDDGMLVLEVIGRIKQDGERLIKTKVIEGGVLTDRKGVNLPGIKLDIPVLVERDFECLSVKNKEDVDWVALSFVGKKQDVEILRRELDKRKIVAGIVSKIERKEALDNFEEILKVSDAIMVARGDLGVEIPLYEVPFWQKHIIKRCREVGKPVITATQMLQSMVTNPIPTRAEISDVANAIYDGTDAVMLSAESASGKYPVESVKVMNREAEFSESKVEYKKLETNFKDMNVGQTTAIVAAANSLIESGYRGACDLTAVVVLTETGTTAKYLSRLRPKLPILVVASSKKIRDQMKLLWGVKPYYFPFKKQSEMSVRKILEFFKSKGEIAKGENVVMIYGELWGKPGLTSVVRIQAVV